MKYAALILMCSFSCSAFAKGDYKSHCFTQPCFIEGDFDGDGMKDRAELVEADHKKGIEFTLHSGKTVVVGAGNKIGKGREDFLWMDKWELHKKETKIEKPNKKAAKPPTPKGDSLLVAQEWKSSAIIYWNGKKFDWYQLEN
ncbi:hypothetical protein B9G69_011905 [Bdellovibrio sp. SKB1291214]|uniref:hypothetical protein n=1 Tax=Bdellovibrio sp. SKB1291214 TaxID=1732569 RepID=UPI000B5167AB|nr:hypothetical protein [Bdellovibrio sp. SKB1291214]UYL07750.1 hypothetical protein B9G69_011905 [Bdellovibrio sp. SKB1291214]